MTYKEAEALIKSLDIKSIKEYYNYAKSGDRPASLPSNPNVVYKNKGWINWKHFIGTSYKNFKKKEFLPFTEAKSLMQTLEIKNSAEYRKYLKKNRNLKNLPSRPDEVYRNNGWLGWENFLGSSYENSKKKKFLTFLEAKTYIESTGISSSKQYILYVISGKKPNNLPSHPAVTYRNKGWNGWQDFLGNSYKDSKRKDFLPFTEAQLKVRSLGIKSSTEYYNYFKIQKKPSNLPTNPNITYKNKGWLGWEDFLGSHYKNSKKKEFLTFTEAQLTVRTLGIKSSTEFRKYLKSNKNSTNLPSNPEVIYKNNGWLGWKKFLGSNI